MSTKKIARSRSARNRKPLAADSTRETRGSAPPSFQTLETRASAKATRAWLTAQTLESIAANVAHSRRFALDAVEAIAGSVCQDDAEAEEVLHQLCQVLHGLQAIGSELRARGVEIPAGEP